MGTQAPDPTRGATLLFGAVRRAVLALLLGRPDQRFYLREIVVAAGGASGAVQRELRALVDAGLVIRENHGKRAYFSANRDAPIFRELQSIVEKTAGAVDVLRTALMRFIQDGSIRLAFVYGSVASGRQRQQSDVDLLVVGDVTLKEIVPALRQAEERLGREVNSSLYPVVDFRVLVQTAPFLKRLMSAPKLFVVGDDRELGRLAR